MNGDVLAAVAPLQASPSDECPATGERRTESSEGPRESGPDALVLEEGARDTVGAGCTKAEEDEFEESPSPIMACTALAMTV